MGSCGKSTAPPRNTKVALLTLYRLASPPNLMSCLPLGKLKLSMNCARGVSRNAGEAKSRPKLATPFILRRGPTASRSEEHTSELQSHHDLVCRLLLEKK